MDIEYYAKPGGNYTVMGHMHDLDELISSGFILMESDRPGLEYVAQADGTWKITDDVAAYNEAMRAYRNDAYQKEWPASKQLEAHLESIQDRPEKRNALNQFSQAVREKYPYK